MWIHCIGYIINLVVHAFLFLGVVELEELELYNDQEQSEEPIDKEVRRIKFRLLRPLSKGHNIVVYIYRSSSRIVEFKELVGRIILMDNRTRWNSWYKMLKVLLNLRPAVEKYC